MSESANASKPIIVGVLSDTHGHLYPAVKESLEGVDHIIHAGDIGAKQVLEALRALAPTTVVRGNCDMEVWASSLPSEAEVELGGVRILVRHVARGAASSRVNAASAGQAEGHGADASAAAPRVVVTGHTHRPASEERDGVLYLNPGSAGPERFGRARTIAMLVITPGAQDGEAPRLEVEFQVVPGP